MRALFCWTLAGIGWLAVAGAPAGALELTLTQIGGTAVGGVGAVGDTVLVSIEATLDAGEAVTAIGPSLEWDTEGGNVLDLTAATEASSVATTTATLKPINGRFRQGAPGGTGTLNMGSFPAFDGPTFAWGWELVTLAPMGGAGPVSFEIGTAEFVLSDVGTTTVGFMLGGPWDTLIFGPGFTDITDQAGLGNITLGTLTLTTVPEPGSALLLGLGLVGLARRQRRRA